MVDVIKIDTFDDLCRKQGHQVRATRRAAFSLEGLTWKLDLTQENYAKLEAALAPFIDAAPDEPKGRQRDPELIPLPDGHPAVQPPAPLHTLNHVRQPRKAPAAIASGQAAAVVREAARRVRRWGKDRGHVFQKNGYVPQKVWEEFTTWALGAPEAAAVLGFTLEDGKPVLAGWQPGDPQPEAPARPRKSRKPRRPAEATVARTLRDAKRAWANGHDIPCPATGKIPAAVTEALTAWIVATGDEAAEAGWALDKTGRRPRLTSQPAPRPRHADPRTDAQRAQDNAERKSIRAWAAARDIPLPNHWWLPVAVRQEHAQWVQDHPVEALAEGWVMADGTPRLAAPEAATG